MQKKRQQDLPNPEELKINPNSLIIYRPRKIFTGRKGFETAPAVEETTTINVSPAKPRQNQTNGFLSERAGARLRKSIKYLLWFSNCFKIQNGKMLLRPSGHISFITLTLCYRQLHSDNYVKKYMLGQFLIELQAKLPGIHFIWRAEKQQNGNIHFHILTNKFVPWPWISATWNRILKKEGYLLAYQVKFRNMSFEQYLLTIAKPNIDKIPEYKKRYRKQRAENWCNPPATHVEDMRTAKKLVSYMSKYLTKNSVNPDEVSQKDLDRLRVEGHLYFCSKEINQIKSPSEMIGTAIERDLRILYNFDPERFIHEEFYTLIRFSVEDCYNLKCFTIWQIFSSNLNLYKPLDLFNRDPVPT